MRLPAPAAALAALLAAACPLAGQAVKPGEPAGDVLKLVDKVIADPADAQARQRLNKAAGRAAALERETASSERAALLAEAEAARLRNEALAEAKRRRVAGWQKRFSRACSLAGDADRAGDAVALYEELLESFPVYSDTKELLAESDAKIRGIFFSTIKNSYPYLAEGRETADERMLAALQFSRASERQMEYGGRQPAGVAEAQLKKARKLRDIEDELKKQHDTLTEGLSLFSRKRWAESAKKLGEVAEFDRENEEALHYLELAKGKLKPAAEAAPAPAAPKAAVKPVPAAQRKPGPKPVTKAAPKTAPKKKR